MRRTTATGGLVTLYELAKRTGIGRSFGWPRQGSIRQNVILDELGLNHADLVTDWNGDPAITEDVAAKAVTDWQKRRDATDQARRKHLRELARRLEPDELTPVIKYRDDSTAWDRLEEKRRGGMTEEDKDALLAAERKARIAAGNAQTMANRPPSPPPRRRR